MYRQYAKPGAGLAGLMGNLPKSEDSGGRIERTGRTRSPSFRRQMFGNKTPEQMMAEDEAKEPRGEAGL